MLKNLKRIFCFVICLFFVSFFVSCGKNKNTPSNDDFNEPTLNVEMGIVNEIILSAYDEIDSKTKTDKQEYPSFSSKNEKGDYNFSAYEQVYFSILMLKTLGENLTLKASNFYTSDESNLALSDEFASKLETLSVSYEKQKTLNIIKIDMFFQKKNSYFAENLNNFKLYSYQISYDEKNKNMDFSCLIEDSRANENASDSNADIYKILYNSETDDLVFIEFRKIKDFDFNSIEEIKDFVIVKNYMIFYFVLNIADQSNKTNNEMINKIISESLNELKETKNATLDIENKIFVSGLTDKFIKIVNSKHISDFIN